MDGTKLIREGNTPRYNPRTPSVRTKLRKCAVIPTNGLLWTTLFTCNRVLINSKGCTQTVETIAAIPEARRLIAALILLGGLGQDEAGREEGNGGDEGKQDDEAGSGDIEEEEEDDDDAGLSFMYMRYKT